MLFRLRKVPAPLQLIHPFPSVLKSYNRFEGIEEEDVATSKSVTEDSELSIKKPSSSEPFLVSNRLSLKSKATGFFPNGSLST